MKWKIIYGLLALILAGGMVISPSPAIVRAEASSVSNVWVELSDDDNVNTTNTTLEYIIHFTTTTALTGGVDTVTVAFPDGTTDMAGEEGSGYAFTLPSSIDKDYVAVDPDGALTTTVGYTDCYTDPDVGTYRVRLTLPEDIAAGASPYIKFETSAAIRSALQDKTTAGSLCHYRVKVETSQDTTAVYSNYFYLGDTDAYVTSVDHLSGFPSPATVGAAAEYKFEFTVGSSGALTAGSDTITVIFPSGTTVPASASKETVEVDADGSEGGSYSLTACTVDPTCHPDSRTVTLTIPQSVANSGNVTAYFAQGFGLVNPTTSATAAKVKIYTSDEPKYTKADAGYTVTADSATKLGFANKTDTYSDDATMINMYSNTIYLQLQDQYANIKAPSNDLTASLSSTSSTGKFYSAADSQIGSATIYDGVGDPDDITAGQFEFLYKDSTAGTHTITASAGSYSSASWTITVAPAVSIYDANNNLVNTYAPTYTAPVTENTTATNSGDYVQNAISDALPGETVKLGDGIYELDTKITIAKAITLESVNGAASTTIRNTQDITCAANITATGSATYGVTIDGITFEHLRSGIDFTYGVYDQSADYITVQNCVFNYIYNRGVMLTSTDAAFTNGTISNNTFTNGGGSSPASTDAAIDIRVSGSNAISGITVSSNTITDQKGKGIYLAGNSNASVSSVSITSNTISSATSYGIQGYTYANTITITSNTVTGSYEDGIDVKGTAYTIKKNVLTGNIGDGIDVETTSTSHLINYNDIYNNTGYGVNVRSGVTTVNTKYNWWGSATGPTYTAATGASVDVSNPGGTGENITDRVTYYEWLYKPIADVIADNAAYYSRVVSLSVGWNTLSTPIILDTSGDTVDELVDSAKMTIAYWYDTSDADSDGTYWEQVATGYALEPCDAIYIKMNATDTVLLKYNATDSSTPTKDLYTGWNLIGLANLESKHVDNAVQSVANTSTNLPGYSQVVSPSMNSSDWTYSSGQTYTNQDMLVGEGYWIYMQNDCTLAGFTITPLQPSLD